MGALADTLARLNGLSFVLAAGLSVVVVSASAVTVVVSRAVGQQIRTRRARVLRATATGWS